MIMRTIFTLEQWDEYCEELTNNLRKGPLGIRQCRVQHYGMPDELPCMVLSDFFDNPNGPYEYHHEFLNEKELQQLIHALGYKK